VLATHAIDAAAEEAGTQPDDVIDLSGEAQPAPPPAASSDDWLNAPAERRCGFALGLSLGPLVGMARGYPNDALKIDREAFRTDTGIAAGGAAGIYLGIALADWFVVGIGPHFGRLMNGDHLTGYFAMGFHIDAFPAYGLGGAWRDLGLTLDAGVGSLQTTDADDEEVKQIDSGVGSRLAFGAVWEGIQVWKLSMGPFAMADMMWSPSALRPGAWLGWRTTFYAGP
jgi:hypothetical protein